MVPKVGDWRIPLAILSLKPSYVAWMGNLKMMAHVFASGNTFTGSSPWGWRNSMAGETGKPNRGIAEAPDAKMSIFSRVIDSEPPSEMFLQKITKKTSHLKQTLIQ